MRRRRSCPLRWRADCRCSLGRSRRETLSTVQGSNTRVRRRIESPPATPQGATMPKTVILSAARTPIGKLGGGLASVDATELGGTAIQAALERADVAPADVQHVIM